MADEKQPSIIDSIVGAMATGIESFLFGEHHAPEKPSNFYKYTHLSTLIDEAGDWGISRGVFCVALFAGFQMAAGMTLPVYADLVFGWLFLMAPAIAPIALLLTFYRAWVWYVQSLFIFVRTNPVLLEVRMPADVYKSPRAMEQVIIAFWIRASTTTFIDRNWQGGLLPYFSLELVSLGGQVHFYIWTRKAYKNTIESAMYAQYPEVEIVEVEDYATKFIYDERKFEAFVTDYTYDPNKPESVYPPKTYIDFELDKDPKEELKVEPFAQVVEVLSSLNKDEQAWIQIVFRGAFGSAGSTWEKNVKAEVDKIRKEMSLQEKEANGDPGARFPRPAWRQQEQLRTIERNLGKLPFEVGMRGIYWAPLGKMRSPEFTAVRWIWKPFANPHYQNQIRPKRGHNIFDYPWQDWKGIRNRLFIRRWLDAYRRRQVFHTPWIMPTHVMTPEILATLWHPPSRTIKSPGLARIPTTKAEPPSNLPI